MKAAPPARVYRRRMDEDRTYGVIGYKTDIEDSDIDPDQHFRAFLRTVNARMGVRTVSSCQGHKPGEQYRDVEETMRPYVTVHGEGAVLTAAAKTFRTVSGISSVKVDGKKALVRIRPAMIGRWFDLTRSLEEALKRAE